MNDEREEIGPRLWVGDLPDRSLPFQAHPGVNDGDLLRQPLDPHRHQPQGGSIEDPLEPIRVRFSDRLPVMPPQSGDVHELRVLVKDRSQFVRVPVVPGLDEDGRDALGGVEGCVVHRFSDHVL